MKNAFHREVLECPTGNVFIIKTKDGNRDLSRTSGWTFFNWQPVKCKKKYISSKTKAKVM